MKAEILKINWGLFCFSRIGPLDAGKHSPGQSAEEILNVIAKSAHQIPKAEDVTEEWRR